MKSDPRQSKPEREDSSLLSMTIIQAGILALLAVSVKSGQQELSSVLMLLFLLGVICRLWSSMSAKHLYVKLLASKNQAFCSDEIVLTYEVRNEKRLPVLWVDILQPLAVPPCLVPVAEDESWRIRKMNEEEKIIFHVPQGTEGWMTRQRCSLVGGWKHNWFQTVWKAVQRGIYTLEDTRIYTGDGFGLTRQRLQLEGGSQKNFVIYPEIVSVNAEPFLQNLWEGDYGRGGILEDPSVMKLTRPYERTDSLKRINWRMTARGQVMTVNQYEVIRPRALHFIFDGESFRRKSGGKEEHLTGLELEEVLSLLASLFLKLKEKGMACGFSFPQTDRLPACNLFAETENEGEIFFRMAEYRFRVPRHERSPETGEERTVYPPSVFLEEDLAEGKHLMGTYFFVTWNEKTAASAAILKKMNHLPIKVMTYEMLKQLKTARGSEEDGKGGQRHEKHCTGM